MHLPGRERISKTWSGGFMNILFPYMARWKAINWTRYHQILTKLAQQGHRVHIFQPPSQKSDETNFVEIEVSTPENFFLHDVSLNDFIWQMPLPLNKLFKKGYYSVASVPHIRRFIKDYQIDVMLLYNIPQYPLLNVPGCTIIFDFADDYMEMLRHEIGRLDRLPLLKFGNYLLDQMVIRSQTTLAVSSVLMKNLKKQARLLPNGVDLSEFKIGSGDELRAKYPGPVIGFIGSFEYFIDFDLILDTAARMPDLTFLLVGSGREMSYIKSRIERDRLDNVCLTGGVPHHEIGKYIDIMDICLNIFKKTPVSHRACPIKLFEYLAMKKPVISTRLEEVQIIDEGYLWYADSTDELENHIRKILSGDSWTQGFIQKGYQAVQDKYNWDVIAQEFVSIASESKVSPGVFN